MKILVTGFDPFGGEKINPAFEVIKRLNDSINDVEVIKLQVPTAFYSSVKLTIEKLIEIKPDFILSIGQAGGRFDISVEKVAINLNDARIADNLGQQPIDSAIDKNGDTAYFSTLPVKAIVQAIRNENIPASLSYTAGTYVCNHLMYGVLNYIHKNNLNIKAGFIHIPYLLEQVVSKPSTAGMDIDTLVKAVHIAIETIISNKEDISNAEGTVC